MKSRGHFEQDLEFFFLQERKTFGNINKKNDYDQKFSVSTFCSTEILFRQKIYTHFPEKGERALAPLCPPFGYGTGVCCVLEMFGSRTEANFSF